jgi:hypothetical protein
MKNIHNAVYMKKIIATLLIVAIALAIIPSCSKGGDGGGNNEANLDITITPANGSNEAPAVGPDFPLKVEVKSTMPASGVKIDISAKKDGSADPAFFTKSQNSTTAVNNFSITGTPATVTCVVTVTVTSITKSSNTWTGTYRYSKK